MLRPFLLVCAVSLLGLGCRNEPASEPVHVEEPAATPDGAERAAVSESPAQAVAEEDMSAVLAHLTQVLRKYSAENRRVPASLNELVAAGYIDQVPPAPAGRTFVVDARTVQVRLK